MTTGWTPDQVRQLPPQDYKALYALFLAEPWGPERDNLHMAQLLSTYINAHLPKGRRPYPVSDFMYGHEPAKSQMTDKQKVELLRRQIRSSA